MEKLLTLVESVKQTFYEYYNDMTLAISESGNGRHHPYCTRKPGSI